MDFSGFILALSSSALTYLGIGGDGKKNLDLAKQNIDILNLLKEKTSGNLTDDETKLLREILSDLQLRYAQTAKES